MPRSSASATIPTIFRSRSALETLPSLKLVNAYAILANQGRAVKPTMIDYVQDRTGKVIYRTDNRCQVMANCNAADWDGKAHAPAAVARPADARPDGGVPDGPYPRRRGRARHCDGSARSRPAACSARPARRPGPTNVWFVGGTPEVVAGVYLGYDQPRSMGGYAQGGRIAAPIFKDFAQVAFKDMPKVPFVAPSGIRWVRIDRASGRRVFGAFPVQEDPKSAVIWEAFQPQTEPRRFIVAPTRSPCRARRVQKTKIRIRTRSRSSSGDLAWSGPRQAQQAPAGGRACKIRPASTSSPDTSHVSTKAFPMRAEAQAHADQINAALALLRRFLDWDRALKHLEG